MAGHDHAHAHTHDHDGDTYFLDQICMVGISGAFGAICLALYIMNAMAAADGQSMLKLLLGPQFHLFVLGSGIALVLVAGIRGMTLWRQAGKPAHVHAHDHAHDHGHGHDHDHGDCEHEHGVCAHEHAHAHAIAPHHHDHAQHHHHDHDEADHDHGWAPWRYVLLLVPIVLFLLGLPNKGPQASAAAVHLDMTQEAALYAGMIASSPRSEGEVLTWLAALYMTEGDVHDVSFKDLESYAGSADLRAEKRGKTIRVRGQFAPSPGNPHVFSVVRFRIQCCGADAIPLRVPMVTRDKLTNRTDLQLNQWVSVTGIVDFQQSDDRYFTMLRIMNLSAIKICDPDNTYIQ